MLETTRDEDLPVIVVGGGPVGLGTALELASHGIRATLLEPRPAVDHSRPRAKTTSSRTMEHLRRWGLADRLRAAAPLPAGWSDRVTFVTAVTGAEITHIDSCLGLRTPPEVSPETAVQISQGLVEEMLRDAVAAREIDARFGWRVLEVVQDADGVDVTVLDRSGERRVLRARWVIGADGPRSTVRTAMRSEYIGSAAGRPNLNITFRSRELAQRIPHPPSIHYWVLDPRTPGVVGPLDLDGTWWAISTGTESITGDREAEEILRGLLGVDVDLEILATDPWQARVMLADEYRDRRLFLAGDAAHQNPPWGGHGFNTGVGDAVNLGWKLAAVLNGWADDVLLDSYATERRATGMDTLRLAERNMGSLSIELSAADGADTAALRDRILALKRPEFHADGLVLGYGYTAAAGAQSTDGTDYRPLAAPGNRLPHVQIGEGSLFDLLGVEFTVIGPAVASAPLLRAAHEAGVPVTHLERAGDVVLVRPDQHIAWTGDVVTDGPRILADALTGFPDPSPSHERTVPAGADEHVP